MHLNFACASFLVSALFISAPTSAAQQLFSFTGTATLLSSGTPIAALNDFAGGQVSGAFIIDTQAAGLQLIGPVGGFGQGAQLNGAVQAGVITLNGSSGPMTLMRTANDFGNILTVDDGGVPNPPENRLDQMGYSTSLRLAPGNVLRVYDILGNAPSDLFLRSLFFGRTLEAAAINPPLLISDATTRDFAGVLTGSIGNPLFLSLRFGQGNPFFGSSSQSLSIRNIQLSVTNISAVPEPASWTLLIAGFGLVGAVKRRRRPLAA